MSLARLVVAAVRTEGRTKSEVARDYRVSRPEECQGSGGAGVSSITRNTTNIGAPVRVRLMRHEMAPPDPLHPSGHHGMSIRS